MNAIAALRIAQARAAIDGYKRYNHHSPLPSPQLQVFGKIGPDEKVNNKYVKYVLSGYPDAKTIDVVINSPGGNPDEAFRIFDTLQASGLHITCRVIGQCCSAATIILLAGSLRMATSDSTFLIHDAELRPKDERHQRWTAEAHLGVAKIAKEINAKLASFYALRTGIAKRVFEDEMKRERLLSVNAAKKFNLVHGSLDPREVVLQSPPKPANQPRRAPKLGAFDLRQLRHLGLVNRPLGISPGILQQILAG